MLATDPSLLSETSSPAHQQAREFVDILVCWII